MNRTDNSCLHTNLFLEKSVHLAAKVAWRLITGCILLPMLSLGHGFAQLQQSNSTSGLLPFSTHQFGIDLATSNITTSIPVRTKTGKTPFSYAIMSNSQAYRSGSSWGMLTGFYGVPSGPSQLLQLRLVYTEAGQSCVGGLFWENLALVDATGAQHPFPTSFKINICSSSSLNPVMTTDGSGYTLVVANQEMIGPHPSGGPWTVYDMSGNNVDLYKIYTQLSWSEYDPDSIPMNVSYNNTVQTYTDTLGATPITATVNYANESLGDTYSYTDAKNGTQSYSVAYQYFGVLGTAFGCSGISEWSPGAKYLPSQITTPTGAKYGIWYESTQTGHTGRVYQITYPSGGYIQYLYSGGSNNKGIDCNSGVVPILTVNVNDYNGNTGTWVFTNSNDGGTVTFTVVVTDPAMNQTLHVFAGEYETEAIAYHGGCPTAYTGCNGSGTALSARVTCFNGNNSTQSGCVTPSAPPSFPFKQTDVYTFAYSADGSSAVDSLVTTIFDCQNNPTNCGELPVEIKRYDWGASFPPSGQPVTDTQIGYGTWNGNGCTALSGYIYTAVCQVSVTGTGQEQATRYINNAQGHPTEIDRWVGGLGLSAKYLSSYFSYGGNGASAGVLSSVTDVNGATTNFNNFTCDGILPQTTQYPVVGSNPQMSSSQAWDCNGGVLTSTTDVNHNPVNFQYVDSGGNADPLWRVLQTGYPNGGSSTTTYATGTSKPWTVSTSSTIDSSNSLTGKTQLDGLGRSVLRELTSDPANTDYVQTTYDLLGRVSTVSTPYRGSSSTAWTSYGYDAIGRVTSVTNPDNSVRTAGYSLNAVQTSDEGNNYGTSSVVTKINQFDGLGRLQYVCDVVGAPQQGPAGTPANCGLQIMGTGFLTQYGYDGRGNMTSVAQPGVINRWFYYDGLSRITGSATPEAGMTNYTYDATGQKGELSTRVSPMPNQILSNTVTSTYTYDVLRRLTQVSYSDGTPSRSYSYDQSAVNGVSINNGLGRLTFGSSNGGAASTIFSYDTMGSVGDTWQCVPINCASGVVHMSYGHNYMEDVTSFSDPLGANLTYSYNAANQLYKVQSSLNDNQHPGTLITLSNFNPFGEATSAAWGNNRSLSIGYDSRGRMTSVSDPGAYTLSLTLANNGNVSGANDSVNGNWTYTYDGFNRLSASSCTGTNCPAAQSQSFTYAYDPAGNRWSQTGGPGPQPQYAFNSQNQINGSGVTYDAAGNMMADGLGNTFTYDAEGRVIALGTTGTYQYDSFGQRVYSNVNNSATSYLYDLGGHLIDAVSSSAPLWEHVWLGDNPLVMYTNSSTLFYHLDQVGSMRNVTGPTGALIASCKNLPFGDEQTCPSNDPSPLHFAGQLLEQGLSTFLFRKYSTTQGRWTSPDPAGAGLNLYSYVSDNPLTLTDPLGLCPRCNPNYWNPRWDTYGDSGGGDCFGDPNCVTYMIDGMVVSPAAFGGAILGQGGSGLEFAFAPGSGIGPVTADSGGALGNWQWVPYSTSNGDCGKYCGDWEFIPAGGSDTGLVLLAGNNGPQPLPSHKLTMKSPARQQCEANAQAEIDAINSNYWHSAAVSASNNMLWGLGSGCAITWETGCLDGAMVGGLTGILSGAGKSMWASNTQLIAANDKMAACANIP